MAAEDIYIKCSDGIRLAGTLFMPEKTPECAVVIASAMGVPKKFYGPFAAFLSDNGIAALTFDYRGVGGSESKGLDGAKVTLHDWGRLDTDAALCEISARFGGKPLFLMGHSCGGQIFGLAPSSVRLSGVIFISAQIPNWRLWPFPYNIGMLAMWYLLIPALSFGQSSFPARRLGFSSVNVPSGATAQWARWARRPGYFFNEKFKLDTGRYNGFSFPLLAYIFDDDIYAPEKSAKALLERIPGAVTEIRKINGRDSGFGKIGHFGFFRNTMRGNLWHETLIWLLEKSKVKYPLRGSLNTEEDNR
ncbi:MAG: alpha/beta fold hydrolase [Desulfobacteraceae bacterium]|nr:MAG: alpha/beta fold hydrolase [Desulfobacteraceae bacterium]